MTDSVKKPACFGRLDKVFPMTDSGLRQTPENCFKTCSMKTQCLKRAMATGQGMKVEEEILNRGEKAGTITFLERWSRKKQASRKDKLRRET